MNATTTLADVVDDASTHAATSCNAPRIHNLNYS